MSISNGGIKLAVGLGGSLVATGVVCAIAWFALYPRYPDISRQHAPSAPSANYIPGGTECEPRNLNALSAQKAEKERARCNEAAENHRLQQEQIEQSVRANQLAEGNIWLAYEQARIAHAQTISTIAAFFAAAIAATFAGFAAWHAKRSADADNEALRELKASERPYPYAAIDYDTVKNALGFAVVAPDTDSTRAIVSFYIKNFGKSPAIIINVAAEVAVQRPNPYARYRSDEFIVSEVIIGPGDQSKPMICKVSEFITSEDHFSMQRGESRILFTGWITYRDIRGENDTIPFGWEYNIYNGKWMTLETQAGPKPRS